MLQEANAAYQKTTQVAAEPRELEASLLLKAAAKLQATKDKWESDSSGLDEALTYNRKLWTVFVASVTRSENPLPRALKENVANLGIFIFNHTLKIQARPGPEKLGILISINRNLAEGLRSN